MYQFLMQRRFAPLFWVQAFSAFNDNLLKACLIFCIMKAYPGVDHKPNETGAELIALASAVMIAPSFFLSAIGGEIADKFHKSRVAQYLKLVEIGAAFLAVLGFAFGSFSLLFLSLGLFGSISALFGPLKYGILPDLLKTNELPTGNGYIEGGTFIAILLGYVAGVFIIMQGANASLVFATLMIGISVLCYGVSLLIPDTSAASPDLKIDKNILRSTFDLLGELWSDTRLWRVSIIVSLFWMFGAIILSAHGFFHQ